MAFSITTGEKKRRNPENSAEKVHKFVVEHKAISGFTVAGILSLFVLRIIPLSWINLLPGWTGKGLVMLVLAQIIAFLPSRWVYQRVKDLPVDVIYQVNAAQRNVVEMYYYRRGRIMEQFDIEGEPQTFNTWKGRNAYVFYKVDEEEKTAKGTSLGEMSDAELFKAREKIEANRLENRKWAKIGLKLYAQFDTLADKVESEYFQELVQRGMNYTSMEPDKVKKQVEEEFQELDTEEEQEEGLDQLLEEVDEEISKTVEIQQSGSNDGEE